ncbi:MAG TPA: DEAD/DEAH box helicase [Saprospiraceae bacterium]|nr:DEAD/DEAH box helicase [Saprospiraceae bacterium]
MRNTNKTKAEILNKLGIRELNPMQKAALEAIPKQAEVVLLSPTGTGKTLAFLLPLTDFLHPDLEAIQALILVPSRELAIQIEQVAREMGSGLKINAVYGGRSASKDKLDLQHSPALLIGTPGRVADHIKRGNLKTEAIRFLILDEFDKSLEVGFEKEMKAIVRALPNLEKKILTSATQKVGIPGFLELKQPRQLDFSQEDKHLALALRLLWAEQADKLDSLKKLLMQVGDGRGIIFCNYKDTIQFVSEFLERENIEHICYYGGLEQQDRERALIQFRNGTYRLMVATDLAARGIDVPALDFIIHYQLPFQEEEFIHRNGRTARMNAGGTAYLIHFKNKILPDYLDPIEALNIPDQGQVPSSSQWTTLFISGGRKDKISKGDIAGLFIKEGGLPPDDLGLIELKQDCAFVAVAKKHSKRLVNQLNNSRLKKRKVRIKLI